MVIDAGIIHAFVIHFKVAENTMQNGFNDSVLRIFIGSLLLLQSGFTKEAASDEPDRFAKLVAPALKKHCVKCHGDADNREGDVNLLAMLNGQPVDAELVRRVMHVLDADEMPPEDEPSLEPTLRAQLVTELRSTLLESVASQNRFSHAPIRRMNRFQYNNAVTDLFDLKCNVFTLPERMMREHAAYFQPASGKMADIVKVGSRPLGKSQLIERRLGGVAAFPQDLRAENGFDNRADHLTLSPLLLESFLRLGQSITQSPDFVPKNVGIWHDFFAQPEESVDQTTEAVRRLEPFLKRAFRRSIEPTLVDRYAEFVSNRIESGESFTDVMKSVAAATISSPKFFYLYDKVSTGVEAEQIDDFELASRLSFFLWGSIPDETLFELATAGELKKTETLIAQVERMLKDRKLKRFCDSFPAQWLQLERIISSVPNPERFPDFYFLKYRDSMHMMMEPLLLFETVLIENQPITQFIDSDFTYRSGLLQEAYQELGREPEGSPEKTKGGVVVLSFHRVPVTDRRHGGMITNAAVMTMTSGPERTKPITRGAWLAGVIFNDPPKPPPADVPPLPEKPTEDEEHLTLLERLAMHRDRSDCKGCHEQIDPLGFALENYNPIGVWRDKYENGRDVDVAGTLFRKHEFKHVGEFKDAILAERDRFTRGFAGHLLSFALARELDASDHIAIEQIAEATAADGYRIQTLIKKLILSKPFQSKSNPENN